MNGAAMDCRQDSLRSQHKDDNSLHSPSYHVTINHPRQQHSRPQHSKAMNYQSFSDPYLVNASSEYLQHKKKNCINSTQNEDIWDPRTQASWAQARKPLELPVPQFEIDENYVGELPGQNLKALDLDTRIDLLIKSKALAGMHPIFCELNETESLSNDSDEFFIDKPRSKHKQRKRRRSPSLEKEISHLETFDDPEKPLSRPPSPFLSRATYLFWFNKAIEIKQQAKEQERALLELAAKKLLQDNMSSMKINQAEISNQGDRLMIKSLLDEVSKELREIVKQEFIRKVLETTAFDTLEDWWEKQRQTEEEKLSEECCEARLMSDKHVRLIRESGEPIPGAVKLEYQGSTSPKVPFPWGNEDPNDKGNQCSVEMYVNNKKTDAIFRNLLHQNTSSNDTKISSQLSVTSRGEDSPQNNHLVRNTKSCSNRETVVEHNLCNEISSESKTEQKTNVPEPKYPNGDSLCLINTGTSLKPSCMGLDIMDEKEILDANSISSDGNIICQQISYVSSQGSENSLVSKLTAEVQNSTITTSASSQPLCSNKGTTEEMNEEYINETMKNMVDAIVGKLGSCCDDDSNLEIRGLIREDSIRVVRGASELTLRDTFENKEERLKHAENVEILKTYPEKEDCNQKVESLSIQCQETMAESNLSDKTFRVNDDIKDIDCSKSEDLKIVEGNVLRL